MPPVEARFGTGQGRLNRREKGARDVSLAIEALPARMVGEIMTAVENDPIGLVETRM